MAFNFYLQNKTLFFVTVVTVTAVIGFLNEVLQSE
jgi:hypothetical protein